MTMKKIALLAAASAATLALAACGDWDDASEDAVADNVEIPADEALAGTPDPAIDTTAADIPTEDEVRETAESAGDAAAAAVADIEAAEAATVTAEEAAD